MKAAVAVLSRIVSSPVFSLLRISTFAVAAGFLAGCGSGGSMSKPPGNTFSGNTSVMLLATSTANDKLQQFDINFTSIVLTNKSGGTVNLVGMPESEEFIHLNGKAEPLIETSVPQGVYSSATATIGGSGFTCVTFNAENSGTLDNSTYAYGYTPSSHVIVNLPDPITISGNFMVLSLNMLVSKSFSLPYCADSDPFSTFSITPTFTLTPVGIEPHPTNVTNGKLNGLEGIISSIDAGIGKFKVDAANASHCGNNAIQCPQGDPSPTWQIQTNAHTTLQGIANSSALAAGMQVDMDVAIQSDGSLLATRIAVYDANHSDVTTAEGPLASTSHYVQAGENYQPVEAFDAVGFGFLPVSDLSPYSLDATTFKVSGQFNNLPSLPFLAAFNSANMIDGQNVLITTHSATFQQGPVYVPMTTATLMPQTVNGTVAAIGSDGGFTTYTVSLASYDLFPNLAPQPQQTFTLANPSSIVMYVDGNTQELNTGSLVVGSVMRFNGLVFNDHGTLKMDCDWINDGVKE